MGTVGGRALFPTPITPPPFPLRSEMIAPGSSPTRRSPRASHPSRLFLLPFFSPFTIAICTSLANTTSVRSLGASPAIAQAVISSSYVHLYATFTFTSIK
ncbi:hypothetical protein BOTBODRAFT_599535 [Botryobasidium botryosum FD-172 SS1]|uniref:Uncharacterized protein n=1 Tax=Botryobasidium botryosum (strain FD-172 SS1) TaxID=930990 RepID=A0A067MN34_BOTB1|nr:hypothetical protein BOTBODRAFT_599535 [Botryobasidium botryosum FD-172 SS1]